MNEELLTQALLEAASDEFKEFDGGEPHKFSHHHNKKMKRLFAEYNKANGKKARFRKGVLIPIIAVLGTVLCGVTAYAAYQTFLTRDIPDTRLEQGYTEVYLPEDTEAPNTIETAYRIDGLPEGFKLGLYERMPDLVNYGYFCEEKSDKYGNDVVFWFRQNVKTDGDTIYGAHNDCEISEIKVGDMDGMLIVDAEPTNPPYQRDTCIVWDNGEYAMSLSTNGEYSVEELTKIALSVVPDPDSKALSNLSHPVKTEPDGTGVSWRDGVHFNDLVRYEPDTEYAVENVGGIRLDPKVFGFANINARYNPDTTGFYNDFYDGDDYWNWVNGFESELGSSEYIDVKEGDTIAGLKVKKITPSISNVYSQPTIELEGTLTVEGILVSDGYYDDWEDDVYEDGKDCDALTVGDLMLYIDSKEKGSVPYWDIQSTPIVKTRNDLQDNEYSPIMTYSGYYYSVGNVIDAPFDRHEMFGKYGNFAKVRVTLDNIILGGNYFLDNEEFRYYDDYFDDTIENSNHYMPKKMSFNHATIVEIEKIT